MDLFKLVGSVFVDTDEANKSLAKTDEQAQKTGTSFGEVAGKAAKVGAAVVGASAAAVTGIVNMASSAAETADTIDKGSIRMGVSTSYYQELGYAAGQSGVEMSTLEKAAKKLEGTDMNLEDAMNQIMSLGTASERSQKAAELFGDAVAYQMSPLIEQSGESFDGLIQRANDLGLVMSEDAVSAGVTLGDTMADVQQSFGMIATNLGSAVMPVVQQFADLILEFMPFIQQAFTDIGPLLQDLFSQLMPSLLDLAEQLFPVIIEALNTLLPIIVQLVGELLPAIVQILEAILPIIPPILDLIMEIAPYLVEFVQMILPIIVELFQKVMPLFVKIVEAILPIVAEILPLIMEVLEAILPILELILDVIGFLVDVFGDIIDAILPVIINLIKNVLTPILRVVTTVIEAVGKAFRAVFEGIKKVWSGAGDFFKGIWSGIQQIFAGVGEFFSRIFGGAWQGIQTAFSKIGSFFSNIWEGLKNGAKAALNFIIELANGVINGLNALLWPIRKLIETVGKVLGKGWTMDQISIPNIPKLARGGQTPTGGTSLVGEEGPELVDLPRGATVVPLNQSSVSIGIEGVDSKLAALIALIQKLFSMKIGVWIDGKYMVGKLAPDIDKALGELSAREARYA